MGTRADFYVGRGEKAEWLGSIGWDGYPGGIDDEVLSSTTEAEYREQVQAFLKKEDGIVPASGWPWPWKDSHTTDYAYAFDGGAVMASNYGREWFKANGVEPECDDRKVAVFPNMESIQKVDFGPQSGVIAISRTGE